MSELKPCPFCGSDPLTYSQSGLIKCCYAMCGVNPSCDSEEDWNNRVSSLGTLHLQLSVLDTEPMNDLVEIICDHRDDMPKEMYDKFVSWCNKHTSDKD